MSDNIIDFNDKFIDTLIERDDFLRKGKELGEEIKKFLPQDSNNERMIPRSKPFFNRLLTKNKVKKAIKITVTPT